MGHASLLGADELVSVRYKDVEEHKIIFIPKRKNDQYREGRFSNVCKPGKVTYPVSITQKLVYLLSDEKDSPFPVIRRTISKRKRKEFHRSKGISYSTLRQEFRMHLSPFVGDISKFGLYSIKSGGASNPGLRNVDRSIRQIC